MLRNGNLQLSICSVYLESQSDEGCNKVKKKTTKKRHESLMTHKLSIYIKDISAPNIPFPTNEISHSMKNYDLLLNSKSIRIILLSL